MQRNVFGTFFQIVLRCRSAWCRRTTIACFAALALPAAPWAHPASDLVVASAGTLPLILAVPHDGAETIGLVPTRSTGARVRDAGTRELAERVASLLEQRLGKRPYLVIARFSRKFLDANRAEQDAMESPDALPTYRAYHGQIASFIADIKAKHPAGALLVDVHGQSDDPGTTFRGTRAG